MARELDGAERGGLFWMSGLRQIRERFNLEKEVDAAREVVFLSLGELMENYRKSP